jgi:uncharacterized protein
MDRRRFLLTSLAGALVAPLTAAAQRGDGVYALADPEAAVAEVKAEALIKPTGRIYLQDYVLFLRAAGGKIAFLREYFDPVRAAKALNTPILGLES